MVGRLKAPPRIKHKPYVEILGDGCAGNSEQSIHNSMKGWLHDGSSGRIYSKILFDGVSIGSGYGVCQYLGCSMKMSTGRT